MRTVAFVVLLTTFQLGCTSKESKFVPPKSPECSQQSSLSEFIVVRHDGQIDKLILSDRQREVLDQDRQVLWYEPNYKIEPAITSPETPHPFATNEALWNQIGVQEYWNQGYFGQGISIAVIDTGVNLESPYLMQNWLYNDVERSGQSGVDDDRNGFTDDILGWNFISKSANQFDELNHGTQIAHVIAGSPASPNGSGIAPRSRILPIDFMDENGGDEVDALEAINYAIERKVNIINNSWVHPCSKVLRQAFSKWSENDVLITNAAGNQGEYLSSNSAFSSNVTGTNLMNIGSFDRLGRLASFSNSGPNIHLYAPGTEILTLNFQLDSLVLRAGTSYSAAIVSGAAALMWSQNPSLTAQEIKQKLLQLSSPSEEGYPFLRLQ